MRVGGSAAGSGSRAGLGGDAAASWIGVVWDAVAAEGWARAASKKARCAASRAPSAAGGAAVCGVSALGRIGLSSGWLGYG